ARAARPAVLAGAGQTDPRRHPTSDPGGRLVQDANDAAGRRPPLNKDTRLCISLAGRPSNIGTRFHNYLYDQLGLDFIYKAFTTTDLGAAIGGIRALGIRGCGVSMPYKEACIEFVDVLEPSAAAIESVNTIVNEDGVLHAYNTDYSAIASLLPAPA